MTGQGGSGRWHLSLAHNTLRARVPMPQQDGAIRRSRGDVTVGRDVALGPRQTGDDSKVAKDDLHDFRRLRGEDSETVVPEAAGDQEATVHRRNEAVGPNLQHLTEVVAQVAAHHRIIVVVRVRLCCR